MVALILLFKVGYVARNDQGRVLELPDFEDAEPPLQSIVALAMSLGVLILFGTVLVVLMALSAVFSALETALFSLQPFHIKGLETRSPRFARALSRLMENPRRVLSGILFADALLNLPLMILLVILMREIIQTKVPFWVTALGIFTVIVLLCDLIPKLVALSKPYRIASTGLLTLQTVLPLVDPIARLLQTLSENVADLIFPKSQARARPLTEDELETLIELSEEQGSLGAVESEMIQEIIKLGNKTVRDCMTPRTDMFALPDDLENAEVIAKVKARRFRRVPIYGETPDDILGVLDVKRYLLDTGVHYMEALVAPSYVPETMKALELLRNFLMRPGRLAIILDEFGGTEGIITLADIIEEIISDAVPAADHTLYIQEIGTEKWLVNAAARLDDLSEHLGFDLEEDGIDTVGGLVFTHFGSLAPPGERIRLGDLVFTVRRSSRKRIEEVVVMLSPQKKEEESGK